MKIFKKKGTLRVDQCTFLIISRSFLLRMRNVSYKNVEKFETHFMFFFFFLENLAVYAFSLQQGLQERTSMSRYIFIVNSCNQQ
jgi:hypothetical protein